MAPGVHGAKSICVSGMKDIKTLFLASESSSKTVLTGHSDVSEKFMP